MDDSDLAHLWKDPTARSDMPVDHPAGEIRLSAIPRRAYRAALLCGFVALGAAITAGSGETTFTTTHSF